MVKQAAVRAICPGGEDDEMDNNNGKLAEFQDMMTHVMHQLIQSPTFTVPVTHLVKQHAEISVTRKAKFVTTILGESQMNIRIHHGHCLVVALEVHLRHSKATKARKRPGHKQ